MDSNDEPEIDFTEIVRRVEQRAAREMTQPGEEPLAGSGWGGSSGLMQNHPFWLWTFESLKAAGPRALFAYAALDVNGNAFFALQEIVLAASQRHAGETNQTVEALAKQITEEETAALSSWMTHWKGTPPSWFQEYAVDVTIRLTHFVHPTWIRVPFPPFEHPGVDPRLHDRKAADEALSAAFRRHRDTYLDEVYGVSRFDAATETLLTHYSWAGRFQCSGESAQAIAASAGVERSSVEQPVKRILKNLGLPQRGRLPTGPKPKKRITQVEQ